VIRLIIQSCVLATALFIPTVTEAEDVPIVTIEAENKPLLEILKELGETQGLNYVVSQKASEAAGNVNCRLKELPVDRAIQMLCAACNLEAEVQGRFVIIRLPKDGRKPRFNFPDKAGAEPSKRPGTGGVKGILKKSGLPISKNGSSPARKSSNSTEVAENAPLQTAVGRVLSNTKQTIIIEDEYGKSATYYLPKSGTVPSGYIFKLKKAVETLRPGHRAVLSFYVLKDGKRVMKSVIGGRDPRKTGSVVIPKSSKKDKR
jgi:hypothetical protein